VLGKAQKEMKKFADEKQREGEEYRVGDLCEGDQSRALQEIPQFELCYRMGYNSPPGDFSEN